MISWDDYPNFQKFEFDCKHTGHNDMTKAFMDILQSIRTQYGRPIFISSGYRDPSHPVEAMKEKPGEHCLGMAADLIVYGTDAIELIDLAIAHGVKRIGLHQKGRASGRFVHLGIADKHTADFPAALWTY